MRILNPPAFQQQLLVLSSFLCLLGIALPLHPAEQAEFEIFVINPDPDLSQECTAMLLHPQESEDRPPSEAAGSDRCSAVVVGDRALLTAAHCLPGADAGRKIPVSLWYQGERRPGTCTVHPKFKRDVWQTPDDIPYDSSDLAICAFEHLFSPTEVRAIDTDPDTVVEGKKVILAGRGCTQLKSCYSDPGGAGWFGCGRTTVEQTPKPSHHLFLTRAAGPSESALCVGDSGGPVYSEDNEVVGIAQAGCVSNEVGRSAATWLAQQETIEWMCTWVEDHRGITVNGLACS